MTDVINQMTEMMRKANRILIFTGAGASVDSGIPDFRSPGGIWSTMDPESLSTDAFYGGPKGRALFWRTWRALYESCGNPKPNGTHLACAKLESMGKTLGLLTQNIDGLHQAAGFRNVRELHGNMQSCYCLKCKQTVTADEVLKVLKEGHPIPTCESCGGPVRPDVVVFGDPLDSEILDTADQWAQTCDLCIVLGSSLTVYPAAAIPRMARQRGAELLIVNRDPTPMDYLATLRVGMSLKDSFVPAVEAL